MPHQILKQEPINGRRPVAVPADSASPFTPVAPPPEAPPPSGFDAVQIDDVIIGLRDMGTDPAKWAGSMECGQVVHKSSDGAEPYLVIHDCDGKPRVLFAANIAQWFRCLLLLLCGLLLTLALPSCVALGVSYDPDNNAITGTATYKWPAGKEPIP